MRQRFKPPITRPADFEAFWDSTRQQLERQDPAVERAALGAQAPAGLIGEAVTFLSLGGERIGASFIHWQDRASRPLVVYSHGYGGRCRPRWDWAARGLNVFGVDIRGCGRSRGALPNPSPRGYVLTGIETPETSVLRTAACDYLQAARVARQLLGEGVTRSVFQGVSFAGGLALMSAAVSGLADLLAVGVPTFGWAGGRHVFVKSGSGAEINRYLEERPEQLEDVMLVLRYFDTVNFATRVQCPALVGIGLQDEVVPAKTVYGIANHLGGPYEIMEFPVSHTELPEERLWDRFEARWLELALHGIPDGFGGGKT